MCSLAMSPPLLGRPCKKQVKQVQQSYLSPWRANAEWDSQFQGSYCYNVKDGIFNENVNMLVVCKAWKNACFTILIYAAFKIQS